MNLLLIFILVPLAEILVFIPISNQIGLAMALSIALVTAVIGGILVKRQGIKTLMAAQNALNRGQLPAQEIFDGMCLLISGVTLITPGFITDAVGFLLLVPAVRHYLKSSLIARSSLHKVNIAGGQQRQQGFRYAESKQQTTSQVIEGKFEVIQEASNDSDVSGR